MNSFVKTLMLSLFALGGCSGSDAAPVTEREGEPLVTGFTPENAQMNAAMEKARSTLAQFEERLMHPPASQSNIALKGRFEDDGSVEHMWIGEVEITSEGYRGNLGNEPVALENVVLGQSVLVRREEVSDWMAIDNGVLVGGYTLRVQREQLPADQRAEFDAGIGFRIED